MLLEVRSMRDATVQWARDIDGSWSRWTRTNGSTLHCIRIVRIGNQPRRGACFKDSIRTPLEDLRQSLEAHQLACGRFEQLRGEALMDELGAEAGGDEAIDFVDTSSRSRIGLRVNHALFGTQCDDLLTTARGIFDRMRSAAAAAVPATPALQVAEKMEELKDAYDACTPFVAGRGSLAGMPPLEQIKTLREERLRISQAIPKLKVVGMLSGREDAFRLQLEQLSRELPRRDHVGNERERAGRSASTGSTCSTDAIGRPGRFVEGSAARAVRNRLDRAAQNVVQRMIHDLEGTPTTTWNACRRSGRTNFSSASGPRQADVEMVRIVRPLAESCESRHEQGHSSVRPNG